MTDRFQRVLTMGAVLVAVIAGSAVIANAASSGGSSESGSSSGTTGSQGSQRERETPLTGDTADKVRAAALEEIPNGTVLRVETDAEGSKYEAHVRRADGTEVVVKVNEQFEVTEVQEGGGPGHRGPGGRPCDRDRNGGSGGDSSGDSTMAPAPGGQV